MTVSVQHFDSAGFLLEFEVAYLAAARLKSKPEMQIDVGASDRQFAAGVVQRDDRCSDSAE